MGKLVYLKRIGCGLKGDITLFSSLCFIFLYSLIQEYNVNATRTNRANVSDTAKTYSLQIGLKLVSESGSTPHDAVVTSKLLLLSDVLSQIDSNATFVSFQSGHHAVMEASLDRTVAITW